MSMEQRSGSLLRSFNHAFQGLVHVFRHQRNMRIHFLAAIVVLVASLFFGLTRLELLAVFIAITFVLMTELINTAVEETIDLVVRQTDPRAKVAKDVAAGAVLVAAMNALVVAYFVFSAKLTNLSAQVLYSLRRSPSHLTFVALALVVLLVIIIKASQGRGKLLSGGLPSGHAAVAFAGWAAITFISAGTQYGVLLSAVAFFMALLTAQTRVEAGIHQIREVVFGAILGILVATLVFQLWF
jgi:diacylglycerol kinase (ATP)